MKKLLIIIALGIFLPSITHATVFATKQHVLFSHGLKDVELSKSFIGEGTVEGLVLSGDDLSGVTIEGQDIIPEGQNEIDIYPKRVKKMDGYHFWKISGQNNNKNFYVFGYSARVGGDEWFENNFIVDVLYLIISLIALIIIIYILVKIKQRTTNNPKTKKIGNVCIISIIALIIISVIVLVKDNTYKKELKIRKSVTEQQIPLDKYAETAENFSENVEAVDANLEFEDGLIYLESESIYDDEENYISSKQYFVILDPDTKKKKISGYLEGNNNNPKLVMMNGEYKIFVQRSEGPQLAEDLGYYSFPSMTYTSLNIPNPGTTWQHGVVDYFVDDDIVYYLQGCRGIFCNIRQFNLSSGEDKILAEDIDVEGMNMFVVGLGETVSKNSELYLLDSFGHAGSAYASVYTFSLLNTSIELLEYETTLNFCRDNLFDENDKDWIHEEYGFTGEECTKEQLELNRRYDAVIENYFQGPSQGCDNYQIEYSNERKKHLLILEGETIELGDWIQLVACQ